MHNLTTLHHAVWFVVVVVVLTHMKNASLCNDECWAGGMIVQHSKSFNDAIFSDTINAINVKRCMMTLLIELYLFIPRSVTLTIFQGHSGVSKICTWKCFVLIRYKQIMKESPFLTIAHIRGRYDIFPHLKKKKTFNIGVFSDTIKAKSFKLCIIITLLGVYIVFQGLMTLTLYQGHRSVRNISYTLRVLILVLCSLHVVWR